MLAYFTWLSFPRALPLFLAVAGVSKQKANEARIGLLGAIRMYAISLGVKGINDVLPIPLYPLLSGINAAIRWHHCARRCTAGRCKLAGTLITERMKWIPIFGAGAGLCDIASKYFPLPIRIDGLI